MGSCGVGVVDGEFLVAVAIEVAADHGQEPERALLLDALHDERVVVCGKSVADARQRFDAPVREALQLDVLSAFPIASASRKVGSRVDGVRDDELLAVEIERARVVRVVLVVLPIGVEGCRPEGFARHAAERHRGGGERFDAVGDVRLSLVVAGAVHVAHVEVLRVERRVAREGVARRIVVEVGGHVLHVELEILVGRRVGKVVLCACLRLRGYRVVGRQRFGCIGLRLVGVSARDRRVEAQGGKRAGKRQDARSRYKSPS